MVKNEKKLDWLAQRVIAALRGNLHAESYVEDWQSKLAGMDRLAVLRQVEGLDRANTAALAVLIGVDAGDLRAAARVAKAMPAAKWQEEESEGIRI